jgi:hypothetical protein
MRRRSAALAVAIALTASLAYTAAGPTPSAGAAPTVSSVQPGTRVITVNGSPFTGRGYNYWPGGIPTELPATTWADPPQCENDARMMQGAGVNLIRLFFESGGPALASQYTACMNSFWNHGIGILWLIQPPSVEQKPTSAGTDPDPWVEHYKPWINQALTQVKDHPASYFFTIDNEADGSVDGTCDTREVFLGRKGGAVGLIDQLIAYAKTIDNTHLFGTTVGGCSDGLFANFNVPHLDFWGINQYWFTRFPGSYFTSLTDPASPAFDARPKIFTEFGEDRYRCVGGLVHGITCATPASGEDQAMQRDWNVAAWRNIAANLATPANPQGAVSGGTLFMYSDLWWYSAAGFNWASQATHDMWGSVPWGNTDGVQNMEWWGVSGALAQGDTHPRTTSLAFDGLAAEWRPGVPQPAISSLSVQFRKDASGLTCVGRITYTTAAAGDTEVQVATDGEVFNEGGDMVQDNSLYGPAGGNGAQLTSHTLDLVWNFIPLLRYKIVARSTTTQQMSATMQPLKIVANC